MSGAPALSVTGVAKRFGGVRAVRDGNLTVRRGELHGLVGPNGSGKSTLLNVVSGLLRPDAGSVVFEGNPLELGHYRKIQDQGVYLVPQEMSFAPDDEVWENVTLGAEPIRRGIVRRRAARAAAARALHLLGRDIDVNAVSGALSPVEQRLVTIARGVVRPGVRLLILDEPTAGLPHHDAKRVMESLHQIVSPDRAVILVSHHIDDVAAACHAVTVMRDGKTVTELRGEAVRTDDIVDLLVAGAPLEAIRDESAAPVEAGDELIDVEQAAGRSLRGVSFAVRRGEVVGLAGVLGSGSGETIEFVSGQSRPDDGTVRVGRDASDPSTPHRAFRAGVGYISGERARLVIEDMTVGEHVSLPVVGQFGRVGVVSRGRERTWVNRSLDALSVKGEGSAPMRSLSGGNQQRALLARWIGADVDVLVVDQPTVGVDIAGRAQLLRALRDLARERAILLAAEPEELAATCDRVLCLRRGEIARELTGDDITEGAIIRAIV
ncbi:MAG TPA: sugar ABC transporter ATP-binding protein [Thermoleophilaceae bacterium]|nr:sugar ABC transporter ATP-binding protein [Thermoleophilaceae bacterium]